MNKFSGWIAFLSNGETIPQTPPVEGERTPWQKLLKRLREDESLEMQRLTLVLNSVQMMSLPKKQCDGFFQAREVKKYFYRSMGEDQMEEIRFQGIGSVIGDQVFIQWVNLSEAKHVTAYILSEVRPLESCKIHTTIQ